MISLSCVFDVSPALDCLLSSAICPNAILRNLLASTSSTDNGSLYEDKVRESILDVYEAVSHLDHLIRTDTASMRAKFRSPSSLNEQHDIPVPKENWKEELDAVARLNICCQLSCLLFWRMLKLRGLIYQEMEVGNVEEIKLLLEVLMGVDPSFWTLNAPEALTWIIFTGAAASLDRKTRAAFIHLGGIVVTAIDSEELLLARQGWTYFRLLQDLRDCTPSGPLCGPMSAASRTNLGSHTICENRYELA